MYLCMVTGMGNMYKVAMHWSSEETEVKRKVITVNYEHIEVISRLKCIEHMLEQYFVLMPIIFSNAV